jgi:plasmid stability protein
MADILVRGVSDEAVARLKERAKSAGRSLQNETKLILERAAGYNLEESLKTAANWRKKLGTRSTNSAKALREDRDR